MEKELKIEIPEGYEIDKENSTFEKIIFQKKAIERWKDDISKEIKGWVLDCDSNIIYNGTGFNTHANHNLFVTKALAKHALATARISQILKNDDRFGATLFYGSTRREVHELSIKRTLVGLQFYIRSYPVASLLPNKLLIFNTEWQADLFLRENEDLLMDYFMLNK